MLWHPGWFSVKEMYSPSTIVLRMSKHSLEHSDWWPMMFLLSFSSLKVGIDRDFSLASVMSLAVMYVTYRQSLKVSACHYISFFLCWSFGESWNDKVARFPPGCVLIQGKIRTEPFELPMRQTAAGAAHSLCGFKLKSLGLVCASLSQILPDWWGDLPCKYPSPWLRNWTQVFHSSPSAPKLNGALSTKEDACETKPCPH